jgi:hypothetical protein
MLGIETADQLVDIQGRFPNIPKKLTPLASFGDTGLPIDGWIVAFMFTATAFEFPRSDLQADPKP